VHAPRRPHERPVTAIHTYISSNYGRVLRLNALRAGKAALP
jgi:hypothetical protein